MKSKQEILLARLRHSASGLILFFAPAGRLCAQPFAVDWFTIDGGGTSARAPFVLSGNVGQPDAGTWSGGVFVLQGGFWAGAAAVENSEVPTVHIQLFQDSLTISWDVSTPGFVLPRDAPVDTPGGAIAETR